MILHGQYIVSKTSADPVYELTHSHEPCDEEIFSPLWAHFEGHGKFYDNICIIKYQDDIKQMFGFGEANSSNKMNVSYMCEQPYLKYERLIIAFMYFYLWQWSSCNAGQWILCHQMTHWVEEDQSVCLINHKKGGLGQSIVQGK